MANEFTAEQGFDHVVFVREFSAAQDLQASRLALQTTFNLDISSDTDSTATKDGAVGTTGSATTKFEVQNLLSDDSINDLILKSAKTHVKLEVWIINLAKKDAQGRYFANYMRGFVNEQSMDADADGFHTGDATFTIDNVPADGYTVLPDAQKQAIAYAFRGIQAVTADNPNGGGVGVATAIELDKTDVSVAATASTSLVATLEPAEAKDPIVFSSYDPSIALVDDTGKITGVKEGNTSVLAQVGALYAIAKVTVTAKPEG